MKGGTDALRALHPAGPKSDAQAAVTVALDLLGGINVTERTVRGASQPHAVVLKPESWPLSLGEELADASELKALLAPLANGTRWHRRRR